MREIQGALKLTMLDKGETYDGLNDGKERTPDCVVVRKDGEWIDNLHGNPADQITEDQAREMFPIAHVAYTSAIEYMITIIRLTLKSNGLELRVGERPSSKMQHKYCLGYHEETDEYEWDWPQMEIDDNAYDKTIPLNQIIVGL